MTRTIVDVWKAPWYEPGDWIVTVDDNGRTVRVAIHDSAPWHCTDMDTLPNIRRKLDRLNERRSDPLTLARKALVGRIVPERA